MGGSPGRAVARAPGRARGRTACDQKPQGEFRADADGGRRGRAGRRRGLPVAVRTRGTRESRRTHLMVGSGR